MQSHRHQEFASIARSAVGFGLGLGYAIADIAYPTVGFRFRSTLRGTVSVSFSLSEYTNPIWIVKKLSRQKKTFTTPSVHEQIRTTIAANLLVTLVVKERCGHEPGIQFRSKRLYR